MLNDIAAESNESTCFVLKKELLAIINELLYRKCISHEDYEAIKTKVED